jgi:hypothetical protein
MQRIAFYCAVAVLGALPTVVRGFTDDFAGTTPSSFWATNGYTNNYLVENPAGVFWQTNLVVLPAQPNSALTQAGGALNFTSGLSEPSFALWTAATPPSASGDWQATLRVGNYKTGVHGFASIGLLVGKYGYISSVEAPLYVDSPSAIPLASLVGFGASLTARTVDASTSYHWEAGAPRVYGSSAILNDNGFIYAHSAIYSNTAIGTTTGAVGAVVTNNALVTVTALSLNGSNDYFSNNGITTEVPAPTGSNAYVYRPLSSADAPSTGEVRLSYSSQQQLIDAFYRESTNGSWVHLSSIGLSDLGMSNSSDFSLGIYGASIGDVVFAEGTVSADNFSLVPEPSTYALLLMTGAGALWFAIQRRPTTKGLKSLKI